MRLPRLVVFASGTETDGGSGFKKLVEASHNHILRAEIVAVVSNHFKGGVQTKAEILGIPFIHFPSPWTKERYQEIVGGQKADYVALSGWLKLARGLDPRTTFNIHPGPLPRFGGPGMYGHRVHEAVWKAVNKGEISPWSEVCMHFVTNDYDQGPVFFRQKVPLYPSDDPEDIAERVNGVEHEFQAKITNMVVNDQIRWDGNDPSSLVVPAGYEYL